MADNHDETQARRRERFHELIVSFNMTPGDYDDDEDAEENPRPYLEGRKELRPWVCITEHEGRTFFLPAFDDAETATLRAVLYVRDDIWAEVPVAVANLDTLQSLTPVWSQLPWEVNEL